MGKENWIWRIFRRIFESIEVPNDIHENVGQKIQDIQEIQEENTNSK